ncbi:MAG: hypothetical protein J6Y77_00560, partial [Paludibacteraceae bacterium]|nr:hypothetical protein [Paludibacteraceae bacterium]
EKCQTTDRCMTIVDVRLVCVYSSSAGEEKHIGVDSFVACSSVKASQGIETWNLQQESTFFCEYW